MSRPLTLTDQKLGTRFRALGQRFNQELRFRDQRLQFSSRADRRNVMIWLLRNSALSDPTSPPGTACSITTSANEDAAVHLAYTEHWVNRGRRAGFRFESSNLRFVITSVDGRGEALQFRLEWAGRREDGSGGLVFSGQGAAHPHWQIDLHELGNDEGVTKEILIDLAEANPVEEIDLHSLAPERPERPRRSPPLRWFHKLHLPARAMWHERPYAMPDDAESQQHEPAKIEEIDNWVLSAIRYVRHEFSTYA